MLDFVIVLLIVLMVTIVGYSESKYLFAKPSCTTCGTGTTGTVPEIKKEFSKALQAVKKQTNEIKSMLTKSAQATKAAAPSRLTSSPLWSTCQPAVASFWAQMLLPTPSTRTFPSLITITCQ